MSLRDRILADDDSIREPVDVPWDTGGEKIYVRSLRFADYQTWLRGGEVEVDVNHVAKILTRCLVDEAGERIFRDADASKLVQKHPKTIMDLFGKVMDVSAISAGGREELEEDFGVAQGELSTG